MITSRTPLRLSLIGGGTDMESFTCHHTGAVISAAIDKYLYITVNPKFDGRIRVSYSRTENVDTPSELQHDIVRECLKLFDLRGIEVVSVSDIPGEGSGLGSSSAFTVGLLRALYTYCGYNTQPRALAELAYTVEAKTCGHPCGRQDVYAAAFGGLRYYKFQQDKVRVESLEFSAEELRSLESLLMLFWTDFRASGGSDTILRDQSARLQEGNEAERAGMLLVKLTDRLLSELLDREFSRVGRFVRSNWALKRGFAGGITNERLDQVIASALNAGATGAKICGAGGGGFLLVVADPPVHSAVETAVGLRRVPFHIGVRGSQVVYCAD